MGVHGVGKEHGGWLVVVLWIDRSIVETRENNTAQQSNKESEANSLSIFILSLHFKENMKSSL